MTGVPVLETARLRLRGFVAGDFDRFAALWADERMIRHILPGPRSQGESWRSFLANAGSWALTGMGQWAIEDRATGQILGHAGFFNALRGLGADFDAAPECGWVLAPEFWGQGYGQEAVARAHVWFDASGHGPESRAMIEVGHGASERLAAAMGYRPMRVATVAGGEVTLFRRGQAG